MNFREQLEVLDDHIVAELGNYELIDFIRIEILLEQRWDYTEFMEYLFDEEWDEEDEIEAVLIYPKLRSKLESFNEDELYDFFGLFANKELVLRELMFLDKEARQNLLDNL